MNKQVTIRPRLDLSPYASKRLISSGEQLNYRLVAMITHLGASQHCGHYTAIGITDTGGYYQFDDSCVRPLSLQSVLNTNAYIIFYELDDSHQQKQQYSLSGINSSNKLSSTQVSGEHNSSNNNNENINFQKHSNNNNNHSPSILNISNTDSKLVNRTETKTTSTTTIIGPQLPDKLLLNGCKLPATESSKLNLNGLFNSSSTTVNHNKLVNLPASSKLVKPLSLLNNANSNETSSSSTSTVVTALPQSSPKQKLPATNNQQTSNSKLVIHFKNTNAGVISTNSTNNNNSSPSLKGQIAESNKNDSKKLILNSLANNSILKATLPSMPSIESPSSQKSTSTSLSSSLIRCSPNKASVSTSGSYLSSATENSINKLTSNPNLTIRNSNLNKISPIKSLVPYESDDESSSNDSETECHNTTKILNNSVNTSSNSNNCKNNKSNSFIDVDENSSSSTSSSESSPKIKKAPKTPPSPAVVKSKTGLWQVTSAKIPPLSTSTTNPKSSSSSPSSSSPSSTSTSIIKVTKVERKNPFATATDSSSFSSSGISTSNFYSSKNKTNGGGTGKDKNNKFNGSNSKKYEGGYTEGHNNNNNNTINQLLKLSHRGYGAPVLSWNGQKTEMEKEVNYNNENVKSYFII